MKFRVHELESGEKVVFYTENSMYDYTFNHVLCIVEDTDIPDDMKRFTQYKLLPDTVLASDRLSLVGGVGHD